MLIDWFTVGAQVLNFLILVWLLKHFLYHPILNAIDAREKKIAQELADADTAKSAAAEERTRFEQKNAALEKAKADLLAEATTAANAERQRLLDQAREDAASLSAKRQEGLQREAQSLQQEFSRRTQDEVFAIARKALRDLAGVTLEERMVAVFVDRLHGLGDDQKSALTAALRATASPVAVRTCFDLPDAQQARVESAVQEVLGGDLVIRFETTPNLVSGIELGTDGHKLAWSIAEYLGDLESSVDELLSASVPPGPGSTKDAAHAE